MKIERVFIVRDPTPDSVLEDLVGEFTMPQLVRYVLGTEIDHPYRWDHEHTTLYTESAEAYADARHRLAKRDRKRQLKERSAP